MIFNGTAVHSQVGQISDYQILPNLMGAKIVKGLMEEPTQSYAVNTALTASTGIKQPRILDDWIYVFDDCVPERLYPELNAAAKRHYIRFKKDMFDLSVKMSQRPLYREEWKYTNLDPRMMETAVSK